MDKLMNLVAGIIMEHSTGIAMGKIQAREAEEKYLKMTPRERIKCLLELQEKFNIFSIGELWKILEHPDFHD